MMEGLHNMMLITDAINDDEETCDLGLQKSTNDLLRINRLKYKSICPSRSRFSKSCGILYIMVHGCRSIDFRS
jgi:hypothetical protein